MKKIIELIIALTLIISLSACTERQTGSSASKSTSTVTVEEEPQKISTEKGNETIRKTTEKNQTSEKGKTTEKSNPTKENNSTSVPSSAEEVEIPYKQIDDMKVTYSTDYRHDAIYNGVYLGNNEHLHIYITTSVPEITNDDVIVYWDETHYSGTVSAPVYEGSKATITCDFTALNSDNADAIYIFSTYNVYTLGNNAPFISIPVKGLDSYEGTPVYVTQRGKKYHRTASCPGDGAFLTTRFDALGRELEPCKKCW